MKSTTKPKRADFMRRVETIARTFPNAVLRPRYGDIIQIAQALGYSEYRTGVYIRYLRNNPALLEPTEPTEPTK